MRRRTRSRPRQSQSYGNFETGKRVVVTTKQGEHFEGVLRTVEKNGIRLSYGKVGTRKSTMAGWIPHRDILRVEQTSCGDEKFTILENTDKKEYRDNVKYGRVKDSEQFVPYLNKKVVIETPQGRQIKGKILEGTEGLVFLPKGKRNKGWHITSGLFDGWYATVTVKKIVLDEH